MSSDPVGSAIASAGVTKEPSSENSQPIKHTTPLDGIEDGSLSLEIYRQKGKHDDYDDDDEDGPVIFDAKDIGIGSDENDRNGDARYNHQRTRSESSSGSNLSPSLGRSPLARASLESVGFSYRDHLLPLSLSGDDGDESSEMIDGGYGQSEQARPSAGRSGRRGSRLAKEERRVGLVDGIALTVGLQIGSGIFSSPGIVTLNTGSIGASLVVWLASGVLAWTGASSFAELGAAIPLNGGSQAYLNYSFGPLSGYLFSWSAIVCLKPASAAIMATIFGEYVARVLYHTTTSAAGDPHEQGLQGIPDWSIKLIGIAIVTVVTALNALSAKLGMRAQVTLTLLKLGIMLSVPILAIIQTARGKMPDASRNAFSSLSNMFEGSANGPGAYALALYSGLWAFDGWDQASYVAGEMKNVSRDLPRVIHISLGIVVLLFLTTVVSYFLVLPPNQVSQTNTVALDFGSAVLGSTGGILFALIVAFSCFGALNGQVYTTARLVYAAGREGHLPAAFGRIHHRTRTPLNALLLQVSLIYLFLLFGSGFASLVNFYGVCAWTFYFSTVLGLLYLRIKEPNLERPYQTWISTPIAFSAVALFLLCMPIFSAPGEALAALLFISAGIPMYYATQTSGRESISHIPGMAKLVGGLQSCMGRHGGGVGSGTAGRGGDGSALFGRRRIRRTAKGAGTSALDGGRLEDLQEDEEEGDEEEALEMLPRDSLGEIHNTDGKEEEEENERRER